MKPATPLISLVLCSTLWLHVSNASTVPALVGYVNIDGSIVVRPRGDASIKSVGLSLESESKKLVPIPPGDLTAPPDPFTFLLGNSSHEIVYGNIGSRTEISTTGLILEAGYEGNPCGDLVVQWGDGTIDIRPVGSMQPPTHFGFCTIPGDTNFDGKVGFEDFLSLSANFGAAPADWPMGDFDYDRQVGFPDFLMLSVNFGVDAVQMASVPEPSGLVAISSIAFWCLIRFRPRCARHLGTEAGLPLGAPVTLTRSSGIETARGHSIHTGHGHPERRCRLV